MFEFRCHFFQEAFLELPSTPSQLRDFAKCSHSLCPSSVIALSSLYDNCLALICLTHQNVHPWGSYPCLACFLSSPKCLVHITQWALDNHWLNNQINEERDRNWKNNCWLIAIPQCINTYRVPTIFQEQWQGWIYYLKDKDDNHFFVVFLLPKWNGILRIILWSLKRLFFSSW